MTTFLENTKEGYITDYISGIQVKATPEEVEAVQVISRLLVEDYNYPKENIQTRPQYRVKGSHSDNSKSYPVDLMIFSDKSKNESKEYIIVECKKKDRKDGRTQLEDYLRFSKAYMGIWYNGKEFAFIKKIEKNGKVYFEDIPDIPKYGYQLSDLGRLHIEDIQPTHNLKFIFSGIRNYLAANSTGTGRDEKIAQQLINLIFCKIFDEKYPGQDGLLSFSVSDEESDLQVKNRITDLFDRVKKEYGDVVQVTDKIDLSQSDIRYIVGKLQKYKLIDCERDVVADAFETFLQYSLKGAQGQFFTPRNIVRMMVEIINPQPTDRIIDPACGTGGFLVESLRHIWKQIDETAEKNKWNSEITFNDKNKAAERCINGIEKDDFLCKVAKAYMSIIGDGRSGVFCEDSLNIPEEWAEATKLKVKLNQYDIVLANPPFGKDILVTGRKKLEQFDLAHKWEKKNNIFIKTQNVKKEVPIQILFIERCLNLLKDGGKLGIILPETFFHAPSTKYILQYVCNGNNIQWIIDLPHNTFRPHNNAKCVVLILQKGCPQQENINMAVAEEMGHDHNGKEIYRWDYKTQKSDKKQIWDDIPLILSEINDKQNNKKHTYTFDISKDNAFKKGIFVPRYYWQNKIEEIKDIAKKENIELIPISELIDKGIIDFFDGHGSPPAEYKGKGEVPYIRVKDIVNWEIYKDPTAFITQEISEHLKKQKEIKTFDIVYVRRGSYRIGSVAMISPHDTDAVFTREILFLRVINSNNEYNINPYYLLYLLSHHLTAMQAKNKILIETTLPNIADRWKELSLPIAKDKETRQEISEKIKSVIDSKWTAIQKLHDIQKVLGKLIT